MGLGFGSGTIVGAARVRLEVDRSRFDKDWKSAERDVSNGARRMGQAFKVGLGVLVAAAGAASIVIKKIGDDASDLNESMNKSAVTFEKSNKIIQRESRKSATALGLSRNAYLDGAASIGAMLKPMGFVPREAATMSKQMVQLASDMASFNNEDPSEMLDRIRSGLAGESEPLRRFGVNLLESNVQLEGQRLGLVKAGEQMTEQEKIQARYSLLLRQTSDQQGDFARTSGGLANQQRILAAQFTDLRARVGRFFLPAILAVTKVLNNTVIPTVERFTGYIERIFKAKTFKARLRVAWQGLEHLGDDLWSRLRGVLFGRMQRKPLKLKTGQILEWDVSREPGLIERISQAIEHADWLGIGARVGAAISSGIEFTGDVITRFVSFLNRNKAKIGGAATAIITALAEGMSQRATQIADVGAEIAVRLVTTLLDPVFWLHHLDLLVILISARFGGSLLRLLGRPIGRLFGELVGRWFTDIASVVPKAVDRWIVTPLYDALTKRVPAAFHWLLDKVPDLLEKAFALSVIKTFVDGVKATFEAFWDWLKVAALRGALAVIEPFSHLPWKLGEKARAAKDRINEELDKIRDQDVEVTTHMSVDGTQLVVSGPGGTQRINIDDLTASHPAHRGGAGGKGAHARGGRIPGTRVAADSVPAMLSPGEFVVTGGGERMLERMTFPGVLNWLEGAQPRHFAAGGFVAPYRSAMSRQGNAALAPQMRPAISGAMDWFAALAGAVNMHGLVPQVLRALSWARGHGWGGVVTSGFRTYAEQAALYARYQAGGPLAAAPGTSSHEFGQAVDVSDYGTFGATMSSAPASARLYNFLGARDPVHYSVSGYAAGGRVENQKGFTKHYGWLYNLSRRGWLPWRDFGMSKPPRRQNGESFDHFEKRVRRYVGRLHGKDVSQLPMRLQLEGARAALTKGKHDDVVAARHALRWWERGRRSRWLSPQQRLEVLQNLASARDNLADLRGQEDDVITQAQAEAFINARAGFLSEFASTIFSPTAEGLVFGSSPLGTQTSAPASATGGPATSPGGKGGARTVIVNNFFNKPIEDPHPLMASARFAAEGAFGT